ncbi:ATP-binding protein [Pseudomonas sp. RP23018S]|uniref:ATP-binding protein n=1 Tax=Pseudomonas sp. RP23018S TaxID=3096037 RepID=UPI002ACA52A3|nr:ATP-binding protein [Pseudomonas sp. RP23018S]MDZ5602647.1 ATP-binding protein [Pseudomonas sp. RP23018S]
MTLCASLTQVLALDDPSQVGHARRMALKLAQEVGFDEGDAGRVALVATELASNVLKHAQHGALHLRHLPRANGKSGIELLSVDSAQGFDPLRCMADGFSTGGTQGIGLGSVSRSAQVFDVHTDAKGSVVLARLYPGDDGSADLRIGVSQHSLHDDPACGDTWHIAVRGPLLSALVIDGLGHGEEAEKAAKAGARAFADAPFEAPQALLERLHVDMNGTRGGAVAIAQCDATSQALHFVGIGNIGATLIKGERTRGLASMAGIVGGQYRKAQVFDYQQVDGHLLILYSDGLQSRWNLNHYPGLIHRHPAVIAAVLHRDFCRGRDDVTVLVIDLELSHA